MGSTGFSITYILEREAGNLLKTICSAVGAGSASSPVALRRKDRADRKEQAVLEKEICNPVIVKNRC
jgi:hypothetical protein